MADLESKLKKIESALGGDKDTPEVYDKLGWHLDYIEELVQEGGDVELKTINGQDLHGEGDIEIKTYQPFGASWPTTSTTKAFCDAIDVDELATVGNAYLGDASFSDLPFSGNGDVEVQIMNGPNNSKAIHLVLTSGNVAPYRWEYTYWNDGSNVSGWRAFATTDYVQANPTLAGSEANLSALQVGNTKYAVPQGTPVEANPTLAGTEAALEGLQVGNTKYKVGGGKKHCYCIVFSKDNVRIPLVAYFFSDKDLNWNYNYQACILELREVAYYNGHQIFSGQYYLGSNNYYFPVQFYKTSTWNGVTVGVLGATITRTIDVSTGEITESIAWGTDGQQKYIQVDYMYQLY